MINSKYSMIFENVSCKYQNNDNDLLKDISFELKPYTINAILGGGGSGKTTICNLMTGIVPKIKSANIAGEIFIGNKSVSEFTLPELSLLVGKVTQNPESMFCNLKVYDEVAFGLENLCIAPGIIRQKVDNILMKMGLYELRTRQIINLSGGQIQRLAIACILVMEPSIILLDEPTANLDPAGIGDFFKLLFELRKKGKTIILTSKDWSEHISLCDQLLILEEKNIKIKGTPFNILNKYHHQLFKLKIFIPQVSELFIRLAPTSSKVWIKVDDAYPFIKKYSLNLEKLSKTESLLANKNEALFSFEDLCYTYPNGTKALKKINVNIYSNFLNVIVGQNGAGKSTLAKIIVGLLKPTSGQVLFRGSKMSIKEIRKKIGFVFQNPEHQFITDSVYDELAYSLIINKIDKEVIKEKVETALKTFKLTDDKTKHPLLLNSGQKRRLAVASILISEPEVIIIDEPTYGQDKYMTRILMQILCNLIQKKITIIMITHDMRLVNEYSDKIFVMSDGNLIFNGTQSDLFANKKLLRKAKLASTQLHRIIENIVDEKDALSYLPRSVEELSNCLIRK